MITDTEPLHANEPSAGDLRTQRIEELGRIIMAYSELTERLQESHELLKSQVVKLRNELSEKNRLLERRNRLAALGEMAAGLAHEIRNPLGGIQLYAGVLQKDLVDRPKSQEVAAKISNGVKRVDALVTQVLQFTREIRGDPRPCDLADVISQAIEFAEPRAIAAGVTLTVDGPLSLPARVDPMLLGQAILNLLLNAIEAQEAGGQIGIAYRGGGSERDIRQFTIEVTDTGPGIAPELLDRIFNPFFTTKDTGTGLGLAIVHRIIEAHDGTITAANRDGRGAKFEIRI